MMNKQIFLTKNISETQSLALNFSKHLKTGSFIAFFGDLGSGKTTFIQSLAKGLGINKRIISPTFIIVRTYDLKLKNTSQNTKSFYHIDLYRTQNKYDLLGLGLDQIIKDDNSIVAVEWAEKMKDLLPKQRIEIKLEYVDNDQRKITIEHFGG